MDGRYQSYFRRVSGDDFDFLESLGAFFKFFFVVFTFLKKRALHVIDVWLGCVIGSLEITNYWTGAVLSFLMAVSLPAKYRSVARTDGPKHLKKGHEVSPPARD